MQQSQSWNIISEEEQSYLQRTFKFKNFIEAWAFMNKVALISEKQDHHPDWRNVYNMIEITLTTHDEGNTISEKDRKLAKAIDELVH